MKGEWEALKAAAKTRAAVAVYGVLGAWAAQNPKLAAVLKAVLGTFTG